MFLERTVTVHESHTFSDENRVGAFVFALAHRRAPRRMAATE